MEAIIIGTKFRNDSKFVSQLLQTITMYPGITEDQLLLLHAKSQSVSDIKSRLAYLRKQHRIALQDNKHFFPSFRKVEIDRDDMVKSIWVLLDFIDQVQFHTASHYPITISFFIKGSEYQIIPIRQDNEAIIEAALEPYLEQHAKRIVIVDTPEQIPQISFSGIAGYCTVDKKGKINYFTAQRSENVL